MTAIGSLCSGYGGLEMGLQSAIGGEVAWHAEYDPDASKILAHHWPDVPNYGDITTTDWASVPRVDWLTAGYPCQTPRATDGTKGGPNQRGSSGDLMLPSAVMLLPTPRATRGGSATETVYLLPTPTAQDAAGSRNSTVPRQEGSTAHPGDTLTDAMTVLTGARTRARSNGGSESSDGRLLGQLSLDEAESG
jgi:hypothetical protein